MPASPARPRTAGSAVAAARPSSARRRPVAGEVPPRPGSAGEPAALLTPTLTLTLSLSPTTDPTLTLAPTLTLTLTLMLGGGGGGGRGVRPQSARQSVQRPQSAGGPADAGLGQPRNEEGALRE
eukprot:scaffold126653_cov27-Phaeocystis_antarctica.AAC.1